MISLLAASLLAATIDPRIALVDLMDQGRYAGAVDAVEEEIAQAPERADALGLRYLHARLLDRQGNLAAADDAYARVMARTPVLAPYARFHLALNQERLGHPEVAAGLVANLLGRSPPANLIAPAAELFTRALRQGGDCRLLAAIDSQSFPLPIQRQLRLASADCALGAARKTDAISTLSSLLTEAQGDDPAYQAARRLLHLRLPIEADPRTKLDVGLAFYRHRDFRRAGALLSQALSVLDSEDQSLSMSEDYAARYAVARSYFWRGQFHQALPRFLTLAGRAATPELRAKALYQAGRCAELLQDWNGASRNFRRAYLADTSGDWSGVSLLSALRVEWRRGAPKSALELYGLLLSRYDWRELAGRAALFLAASEIAQGRTGNASHWLAVALHSPGHTRVETDYWRGRLAELESQRSEAVRRYLEVLVRSPDHPLAQDARRRLHTELASAARARARVLMQRGRLSDLYRTWLLTGTKSKVGALARRRAERRLQRDSRSREFLTISPAATSTWPLWKDDLDDPDTLLLALGQWREGSPAVLRAFPPRHPRLAYTAALELAHAKVYRRSLLLAEILSKRVPRYLPYPWLPARMRKLLYPFPYRSLIESESEKRHTDAALLVAILREESSFDAQAHSSAAARGLAQLVLPTARKVAERIGMGKVSFDDLEDPPTAVALGASHLAQLQRGFGKRLDMAVAAYNAGAAQAELWQSYCFTEDRAEYFTKIGFSETRDDVAKVLSSRTRYLRLYPEALGTAASEATTTPKSHRSP